MQSICLLSNKISFKIQNKVFETNKFNQYIIDLLGKLSDETQYIFIRCRDQN